MKYINCQSEIRPDFRFCPICGIEIVHLNTQTEEIYFEDRGNQLSRWFRSGTL